MVGFRYTACFFLLFQSLQLFAQTTDAVAAFDSQYVETGNPFLLHLSVPEQYGQPKGADFSAWEQTLPAENRLNETAWNLAGGHWTKDLTFISFDSAQLQLPPLPLLLPNGDTIYTNALELTVLPTPSPDDPADMFDIKDIHRETLDWRDYLRPALPVILGLLLFALILSWVLSRRKKSGLKGERTIRQAPHELALRKLSELERQQHWQNGRVKTYYSELTHILREYLENRYHIPALESASDEILRLLLRTEMPSTLLTPLSELLRWADLAKFAKGTPPESFHAQALHEVRHLVEQTKHTPAPSGVDQHQT